jgi:group II intron reverse transcriptase/maturase
MNADRKILIIKLNLSGEEKKLSIMIKVENKKKKVYTKEEKKLFIQQERDRTNKLSQKLNNHTTRNQDTGHINYKVFHLLHDPFTIINAYSKISKNKGALTTGIDDDEPIKNFGLAQARKIAKLIKSGRYRFKPVKRTLIPKPGKSKKRPIDVFNQTDRIVQEAMRGILEAIYEPVFIKQGIDTEDLSNNYGFRPNISTWDAIKVLEHKSKRCNTIIEGDIVSAYNHVDHDLLINTIKQRVKDKKFIKFLSEMLKSGVMDVGKFEHSLKGTPQGGIVSPLLFNIYMLGFDQYVYNEFIVPILTENEQKYDDVESKAYGRIRRQTQRSLEILKETKLSEPNNKKKIKENLKDFKRLRNIRNKTPYPDVTRLKKGAVYVRYADDWILAITCTKKEAEQIKTKISEFLLNHKKMQLDEEKTKITSASKGYKFLGFEIRLNVTKPKLSRVLLLNKKKRKYTRPLRRTTSRNITIEPDSKRILDRMKLLKFCNSEFKPIGKGAWTVYDDFQIVLKYTQIMRGIFKYYGSCQRLSRLTQISYILQYSCAKTLARRKKMSVRQIFKKVTPSMKISIIIQGVGKEFTKKVEFLTLPELRKLRKKTKPNHMPADFDPFRIQEHWRTKLKFYNECCICGATEGIALHHNNSLGSIKEPKRDRYEAIRSQIKRIQIPVCNNCHNDITYGKYNNPKIPIEFYNEFLAKL